MQAHSLRHSYPTRNPTENPTLLAARAGQLDVLNEENDGPVARREGDQCGALDARVGNSLDGPQSWSSSPLGELQSTQSSVVPHRRQLLHVLLGQPAEQRQVLEATRPGPKALEGEGEDLRAQRSAPKANAAMSAETYHTQHSHEEGVDGVLSAGVDHLKEPLLLKRKGLGVEHPVVPLHLRARGISVSFGGRFDDEFTSARYFEMRKLLMSRPGKTAKI